MVFLKYKSKNKSQLINLIKEKEQCPKEEEKEEEIVEEGIKFIDLFLLIFFKEQLL